MDLLAKCTRYETYSAFRIESVCWGFFRLLSFRHASVFNFGTGLSDLIFFIYAIVRVPSSAISGRHLLTVFGIICFIEVLEYIGFLIGRVVSDILLDVFNLLDKIELVFLSKIVQVKFNFFFLWNHLWTRIWARPSIHNPVVWTWILYYISTLLFLISTQWLLIGLDLIV